MLAVIVKPDSCAFNGIALALFELGLWNLPFIPSVSTTPVIFEEIIYGSTDDLCGDVSDEAS